MSEEKVETTSGRSRTVQGSVESAKMDKTITVKIINDDEEEDDEHFTVRLFNPRGCALGHNIECDVTIQDDDGPGELHRDSVRMPRGQRCRDGRPHSVRHANDA